MEFRYSTIGCFNTIRMVSGRMKFNALIPELSVRDIERSKWFYVEILGFQLE